MSLSAHALAFGHRGRTLAADLELALMPGRVLCVLGPNGAGKTTLFRTLLGLLPPIAGRVSIDGRDLATLPRTEIARSLAYVPQASASVFDFTLIEIVEMGRTAHLGALAAPDRNDERVARESLERLGIGALADRPMGEVSGGERQLALIARALATEARNLVMDEPTANLDFGNQARVIAEVRRLREGGFAVLLCTHDPDHAFEAADEVLLLGKGGVLAAGRPEEALTIENLARLYGVPPQSLQRKARFAGRNSPP